MHIEYTWLKYFFSWGVQLPMQVTKSCRASPTLLHVRNILSTYDQKSDELHRNSPTFYPFNDEIRPFIDKKPIRPLRASKRRRKQLLLPGFPYLYGPSRTGVEMAFQLVRLPFSY